MCRWLDHKWFQYKVCTGFYVCEVWEQLLLHIMMIVMLGAIAYGLLLKKLWDPSVLVA
jgi:hypothetical protein